MQCIQKTITADNETISEFYVLPKNSVIVRRRSHEGQWLFPGTAKTAHQTVSGHRRDIRLLAAMDERHDTPSGPNRPGTATQQKGLSRLLSILDAARDIFMEQGYSSLTPYLNYHRPCFFPRTVTRKVAAKANISIGNLNYYYRTKEDLLRDLIDYVIIPYLEEFDRARTAAGESPVKQLQAVLDFWIDDLSTPETTAFFPECWALANHNPFVAELMDEMYAKARQSLNELIPQINPTLTQKESEQLALYMCASMEGLTVFAGYKKPWSAQLGNLKKISINNFMDIIKNTKGSKRINAKSNS